MKEVERCNNTLVSEKNGTNDTRTGTVSKTITVRQFDEASEYFNPINSEGIGVTRPSTEYNHPLAQWAMKLAYSAYMPLTGQLSGIAPGMFMETGIRTAQEELEDCGFESRIYNNGENDTVCHIIGHKQIYTNVSNNLSYNTNGGNNNGYLGILEGTGRCKPIGVFSGSNQSGLRTDDFVGTVGSNCTGNSEIFGNTLNSDNTDCIRTLVVVDIRGTSTNQDWLTDFVGTHVSNNISDNTNGGNDNATLGVF